MGRVVLPAKYVAEEPTWVVDFLSEIPAGETIVSAVVTAVLFSGTDPDPNDIVDGGAFTTGTRVSQRFKDGIEGNIYDVIFQGTASGGGIYRIHGFVAILPETP